jgi:hypothetical protein
MELESGDFVPTERTPRPEEFFKALGIRASTLEQFVLSETWQDILAHNK